MTHELTSNHWMGIDPGLNGSVASICEHDIYKLEPFPKIKLDKKTEYDINGMINVIGKMWIGSGKPLVILEKAQAMPGQGVTSMFSIGKGYGILLGILNALQIPYFEIHPRVWANQLLKGFSGKGKDRNYKAASALFPKWNPKYKYEHEWADSLLLAYYGKIIHGTRK